MTEEQRRGALDNNAAGWAAAVEEAKDYLEGS
jgi:hypothetical protein